MANRTFSNWRAERGLLATSCALSLALAGCGGGNGATPVAGIPAPPSTSPTPTPPAPTAPFGVTASTDFAEAGYDVQIRWNAATNSYEMQLLGKNWDTLTRVQSNYYPPSSAYAVSFDFGSFKYSGWAHVAENGWGMTMGDLAFGIPTAAAAVPTTGSATYDAVVHGDAADGSYLFLGGTASLAFDFAAGTLAGRMDLVTQADNKPVGRYDFVNTVYSVGSPTFSGKLSNPDIPTPGTFSGSFTGPAAEELISGWNTQMRDSTGKLVDIVGVWIGKK